MLQQLESDQYFDFKRGYESSIYEVHKQYRLISENNNETPIKRSIQTQTKIIKEAPVRKVFQILPRGTLKTSTPRIVDITSTETQTEPIIENNQNKRNQGKAVETQTEMHTTEKHNKDTQTAHIKEDLNQTNKLRLPFNIKNEIDKLKISVPFTELVKNKSYR